MEISPLTESHEDILVSVEVIAEQRRETIEQVKQRRAAEEERHSAELRAITQHHRNANRVLVQAIEAAHARGIPKRDIYQRIGMTTQRFGQLRRAVDAWDREESNV